ncbi:uncharacterized protein A1O9_09574 [Exophiala aquamarina CBS 119918]|uniref:Late embryogenesis abundant protein LEA-2 subgroup domain-containing protein n=1 Tax=Exophiala aquamarina CBS 119918 TaxID=1182545 RepID=A0A072P561_9EURO|nr:uncharacterized protein A1O9_09574 [Exophiala aquamarina CBS 119918]KEF54408.1 hypothetical protein A1O9_09574 [Exophiala aquamarina CBS 119918]
MVLISTIALVLSAALSAQATGQAALQEGVKLDPKATASIQSIFKSFTNPHIAPEAVTACCGEGCAIGLCNGRPADSVDKPTARVAASDVTTTAVLRLDRACCSRSCPDGHCRLDDTVPTYTPGGMRGSFPGRPGGRPGLPAPFFPGRPDSDCPGDCGRECGISCPCVCARKIFTSVHIDPAATSTTTTITGSVRATAAAEANDAKAAAAKDAEAEESVATAAGSSTELDFELTAYFHTTELAGLNQDVIPVVVETASKDPVTLLADIDLALMENYISSFFIQSLNLTSALTAIPKTTPRQEAVALGIDGYLASPHSTIKLDLLAGPSQKLKKFHDVSFKVFDLPFDQLKGKWEPELFLGVTFLRQASALTLTKDFAGQAAVGGIPLLARDVVVSDAGWDGAAVAGKEGNHAVKDEL